MHRCASVRPRGALLLEAPAAQGTVKRLNDAKGFGFVQQDDGGLQVSRIYGTHGNIAFDSNGLWALVLGRRKRLSHTGIARHHGLQWNAEGVPCFRTGGA